MIRALLAHMGDHVTAEGDWSILLLNSVLLIPLIFAVFFYPVPVLVATAICVVVGAVFFVLLRYVSRKLDNFFINGGSFGGHH